MRVALIVLSIAAAVILLAWAVLVVIGRRFALRDRLQKADAIVALAGTRGNIRYLDGKIETAARLYQAGWAPFIIFAGRMSGKVSSAPNLISSAELHKAIREGRISEKDYDQAAGNWDLGLGASYMRERAITCGVPAEGILIEDRSLHTTESAEFVAVLLAQHGMRRIILVTSPFHQLRAFLTFTNVLSNYLKNGKTVVD